MRRTPSSTKSTAKKVKKRNPWSDDESKSESDLEENEPVIIPRDSLLRRAAGTPSFFVKEALCIIEYANLILNMPLRLSLILIFPYFE